jgi:hypothetical protein
MTIQTKELLFLKSTGVLIGEVPEDVDRSKLNLTNFDTKVVELDESTGEYWHGDFATGEIRSAAVTPLITEADVRYSTNVFVLEKFPLHTQLNIIIDMLDQSNIAKTEKFIELKSFLDSAREMHRAKIELYSNNSTDYTWLSIEEEKELIQKKSQI